MYFIRKSIDIDFAHHVAGHAGPCANLHGHTWKFEVGLSAQELDKEGFVVDFKHLKEQVLKPCHALLDHCVAMGSTTYEKVAGDLAKVGVELIETRRSIHGTIDTYPNEEISLKGGVNRFPGGMKVAVFSFNPTSERMAKWLYDLAKDQLEDGRIKVVFARIYETLHPVESVAEYRADG
jgi:6-pyruvoyl tetrahydropterin synthase/QueD family protein